MSNIRPIHGPGWDTQDPNEYDPNKRYTASADAKGHSGYIKNLKVPSDVVGQLAVIVESGVYDEYTSQAAIVRDALHHHLEKIQREIASRELGKVLSLNRLNSMVQQRTKEYEQFTAMMAAIKDEVLQYLFAENALEAKRYIAEMFGHIHAVPNRFQGQFESELDVLKERIDALE